MVYNYFIGFPKTVKRHKKWVYYIRMVHSRLHFGIFQMVLASVVILNVRTLLHLKIDFKNAPIFLTFDKAASYIILFAYWVDLCTVVHISLKFEYRKSLNERKFQNTEEEKEKIKLLVIASKKVVEPEKKAQNESHI